MQKTLPRQRHPVGALVSSGAIAAALGLLACTNEAPAQLVLVDTPEPTTTDTDPSSATGVTDPNSVGTADPNAMPTGVTSGINSDAIVQEDPNTLNEGQECAGVDTPAELENVVLLFVFDVSASMGSEVEPYYSRSLKWDPVVQATKAFFTDPESAGVSATLTFFPNDLAPIADSNTLGGGGGGFGGGAGPECDAAGYSTPDVPLTALPSDAFGAAIDVVTPPDDNSWLLGTPTLAALQGTFDYVDYLRAQSPNSSYNIVLVTDGMPALCDAQSDSVNTVANAVAGVADETPTYVIGVENPVTTDEPNPPDSVSDLNQVAQAGGTGFDAFLIDTTDPVKTATDLKAVIDTIRESSFSCTIAIPAPPDGETFDQNKVNVQFTSATGDVPYEYDQDCAGASGWAYDDVNNPTAIEICPSVCDNLRATLPADGGELSVQLGCEQRTILQ